MDGPALPGAARLPWDSPGRTLASPAGQRKGWKAGAGKRQDSEVMSTARRTTRTVRVGDLKIGSVHPIAVQSMTTTTPAERDESLAQIRALRAAGCALVRLAVPSVEAARALGPLREALRREGIDLPLVADVHFLPAAALEAAAHAEKVRINPGNFAPAAEAVRPRLAPLIDRLRERGGALRIGVNHGSLAPYLTEAQGHGPEAMVASALEYVRHCWGLDFRDLVVSLKASNPAVMVAANRLLAERLDAEGYDVPIHLGVTEAGEGAEGELRSAVGIGALLLDGIGDTIRVSLTGDPAAEI
ncbi:MAG: (E)-4-hydroxy-3-methylbut-2-enyl-diphosphate synthase, partial [Candidatus Eisenbacteria bacterium]|nr:(E)-4-hydroxy-3-methylbut-2-enyl-diphosphate synthase [Candidatus Eisenbacteria bacterium]